MLHLSAIVVLSRFLILSCLVAALGCTPSRSGDDPADAAPEPEFDASPAPEPEPELDSDSDPEPEPEPGFPANVRSLELLRSIVVRVEPTEDSERYGTIAAGTRVAWKQVIEGADCDQRWVEIEPRGWVCEVYLSPSERGPHAIELPRLKRGEIVPGVYGKVKGEEPKTYYLEGETMVEARAVEGSVMVRQYDTTTVAEVEYWRISPRGQKNEYLAREFLREYRPSDFQGTRLSDDTGLDLPVGFAFSRERASAKVPVLSAATKGRVVDRLRSREPAPILETTRDGAGAPLAYRIGPERWVRAGDMRVAQPAPRPEQVGDTERWLDIDLDGQVLVAYEGDTPVYATLVSTGSKKYPTPTGVYRIWVKFAEKNMSDLAGEDPYSVSTVPWAQFYDKDFALHTAYWHDTFGTRRSHGCTNLAPADARFLYFWSEPSVPPGWSMAKGSPQYPGTLVRVRSSEDPEPAFQGYAADVRESRKTGRSGSAAGSRAGDEEP